MPLGTRIKLWLPAVAWAAVISILSTEVFSSDHTSRFIVPMLHWLFPSASPNTLEFLHMLVRKSAHLTEYFILSILLMRALRAGERAWSLRWALWAIAIAAGYAALDEFHQSFVASRTASPWDSLIDTAGVVVAEVVVKVWSLQKRD